jgi:hypothetical protein
MFFSKSWRVWIVEELVPKVSVCARTVPIAALIALSVVVMVVPLWNPQSAGRDCRKAKARAVEVYASDVQRARPVLVEEHLQIISSEQVDAIVGGVSSQLINLLEQGVVVALKGVARGARSGDGGAGEAECRLIRTGEREAGIGVGGGEHKVTAAVVGCRQGARAAEAGGAVDGCLDRAQ